MMHIHEASLRRACLRELVVRLVWVVHVGMYGDLDARVDVVCLLDAAPRDHLALHGGRSDGMA
jgi:hypothetical protein